MRNMKHATWKYKSKCAPRLKKVCNYFPVIIQLFYGWLASIKLLLVRVVMLKESIGQSTLSLPAQDFSSLNCDLCWYTLDLFCHLMLNLFKLEMRVQDKWSCDHSHMLLLHILYLHETQTRTHTAKTDYIIQCCVVYGSSDCGTDVRLVSSDYIRRQPPPLHTFVILNLSAAAWTMIQACSQRSEQ